MMSASVIGDSVIVVAVVAIIALLIFGLISVLKIETEMHKFS